MAMAENSTSVSNDYLNQHLLFRQQSLSNKKPAIPLQPILGCSGFFLSLILSYAK